MDEDNIKAAMLLARAFERQAKRVLDDRDNEKRLILGTRQSGTLRRLSLDLTRALTDMRRP